jgi:hypothetical protein
MVQENPIKRKLKTDFQRYVFKAIPQGFSSTNAIANAGLFASLMRSFPLPACPAAGAGQAAKLRVR